VVNHEARHLFLNAPCGETVIEMLAFAVLKVLRSLYYENSPYGGTWSSWFVGSFDPVGVLESYTHDPATIRPTVIVVPAMGNEERAADNLQRTALVL